MYHTEEWKKEHSKKMKEIVIRTIQDYGVSGHEDWMNSGKMVLDLR